MAVARAFDASSRVTPRAFCRGLGGTSLLETSFRGFMAELLATGAVRLVGLGSGAFFEAADCSAVRLSLSGWPSEWE